jgi:hypothetical protein
LGKGDFGFWDVLACDILSPSIDIPAVTFPREFAESLGRLETHGDVSVIEFTA